MTIVLTKLQHSQIEKNSKTKLQAFQRKIYLKAKQNPNYKFYCLYDKVLRQDTLEQAYKRVRANKGTAGIDRVELKHIKGKEHEFIAGIQTELKQKTYRPSKLRAVPIPKKNDKTRTLHIPTIKDRVIQTAVKLIIEPIFEADFKECSYGYRPRRSAHLAIGRIQRILFKDIYAHKVHQKEAKSIDLTDCFSMIPHKELMHTIAKRIIDRQLLKLIKMFVQAEAMREQNEHNENTGTPQGGVVSPLLANIYLDKIDTYWKDKNFKSDMVRYADDIVVIHNKQDEHEYNQLIKYIETDLQLKVNQEKSQTRTIQQGIEYLGFHLKQKTSRRNKQYVSIEPTKEAMNRIRGRIREITKPRNPESTENVIKKTNETLKGWQQYFDNIAMGKSRHTINRFTELRIAKMISRRNKRGRITWKLFENKGIYTKYGLYRMKNLGKVFV